MASSEFGIRAGSEAISEFFSMVGGVRRTNAQLEWWAVSAVQ